MKLPLDDAGSKCSHWNRTETNQTNPNQTHKKWTSTIWARPFCTLNYLNEKVLAVIQSRWMVFFKHSILSICAAFVLHLQLATLLNYTWIDFNRKLHIDALLKMYRDAIIFHCKSPHTHTHNFACSFIQFTRRKLVIISKMANCGQNFKLIAVKKYKSFLSRLISLSRYKLR